MLGGLTSCEDAKSDVLDTHAYIKDALKGSSKNITVTKDTLVVLDISLSNLSSEDNHYKFEIDQDALEAYNKINGTSYIPLPDNNFNLSNDILIEAGAYTYRDTIEIKEFTEEMNASGESYALPLKLVAKDNSIATMPVTGTYIYTTSGVFEFSSPMFTNAANLKADGFPQSPETYGEYTIEVRFQVSNTGDRDRAIFKNPSPGDVANLVLLRFEDPQSDTDEHKEHSLVQIVGRNRIYLNPLYSFEPNKWQHLALTCDGSSYRLYVNGEFAGVISIPAGPTTFTDVNWFSGGDGSGDPWRGCKILMAEARMWSVCRTELQIKNNITIVSPNSPGLEGYWRFNEGEGNEFKDATGKGHTLRTSKTPTWVHGIKSNASATEWP